MGAPFGITFADFSVMPTSRPALQAAEYAREHGRFPEFHAALFAAYFSQGLDIGTPDVLRRLGCDVGLDGEDMLIALQEERYMAMLRQAQEKAGSLGVTGVPTFFINGKERIVGAQRVEVFRKALQSH
jgi:predicted DsbA family dithiol-disulfide isomerase